MIQIIFVILVILHALENALRIKRRLRKKDYRNIHHATEAIIYTVASIIVSIFGYLYYEFAIWELVLLTILTRVTFFNPSINLFRGLKVDHENPDSGSKWDWVSRFLPFWHKQIIFTSLYIILILHLYGNS
jgi:hypothetical protein